MGRRPLSLILRRRHAFLLETQETLMSDDAQPEGPDFTQGVAASDIAEGAMLAGRVGNEAVLIARLDGVLYAIGGECTHWRGPLGQGLRVGDTVRCPWHHACFSLKTGEAIRAPAIDPVPCWTVEEAGGQVFVKAKKDAPQLAPSEAPPKRVVIVGGGAAGFAAAQMLRREGFAGDVVLLSADADAPYDRPNCSKHYLSGDAPKDWMPLREDGYYAEANIDLRLNTEVTSFDAAAKTVTLEAGDTLGYDILILATGAEPQVPPVPGLDGPNAYRLRTLRDADALIAAAQGARRAAVIGASFIGLEVAAALKQRGLAVSVIAPEATPLEKVFGHEVGEWVRGVHEKEGVVFHLGVKVLGYADGLVTLDRGGPVAADLVVVGTGVKPRVALAEAAGLTVDNGVVVDEALRTSAPDVYAAGDIARYPDPISGALIRVEHWVHAERQGQYLARRILGGEGPFRDVPFFWTNQYQAAVMYSGHAEGFDPPQVDGDVARGEATIRYTKDGALLAVATLDRDLASLRAEAAFEAREGGAGQ
jgi:NADPH-dependent 2,4-dienoyl-CoA reductase/sulfur reductase-like enzyme/nitrite reductase/ring-hydroxylating ferredoxin subunit